MSLNKVHPRVYGLDILRAFAILAVVYSHGLQFLPKYISKWASFFDYDGVAVFFVLSGFLIGSILIKTLEKEGPNFKALLVFMYKRWFRTLPPYYLILSFLTFYYSIWGDVNPWQIKKQFVFLENFNRPHPDFFPEAWSLAVEEWFYLLVPFTAFVLTRFVNPKHVLLLVILSVILVTPVIRYNKGLAVVSLADWDAILRKQVITRLDSIIFGLLGAYINYYYHHYWLKWKVPAFVIGLLLFLFVSYSYSTTFVPNLGGYNGIYYTVLSFSLTSFAVLLVMPVMNNVKHGTGFFHRTVTFVSLISYSMYLVNLTVVQFILVPLTVKYLLLSNDILPYCKYGLFWFYTIFLSYLLYAYFEKPTMQLRDKLLSRKRAKEVQVTYNVNK